MGGFHTIAVAETGVAAFGSNATGQLGIGRRDNAFQPVSLPAFAAGQVATAACGTGHTLFLCRSDTSPSQLNVAEFSPIYTVHLHVSVVQAT